MQHSASYAAQRISLSQLAAQRTSCSTAHLYLPHCILAPRSLQHMFSISVYAAKSHPRFSTHVSCTQHSAVVRPHPMRQLYISATSDETTVHFHTCIAIVTVCSHINPNRLACHDVGCGSFMCCACLSSYSLYVIGYLIISTYPMRGCVGAVIV